ncbi:putative Nudix hydrolase [Paenibacillus sp. CCS19]|uniref:NUDIX hydrolase n=1 Tax=Paenibacillus sp. CCS19 TaxID=3158387 RepID=UPI00256628C3|nr:NUDIX domain-containing protein [Paenibacillus cellulosilyticus]GMK38812.1 putative Nudix hydrolase [Paenibacillus cellulosilyticus]
MENEMLKIFDDNRNQIGIATREEVHKLGHWHEAFHCWFISKEDKGYIYLQLRSAMKKDYPSLFDITAAGHLLAHETVLDGVREIKEEIGIDVSIQELIPLGIIEYCVNRTGFIDKELTNVYLFIGENILKEALLQREEVAGIVRTEFESFYKFWMGELDQIRVEGYEMIEESKISIDKIINKDNFVPHEISYYENVVKLIAEKIR